MDFMSPLSRMVQVKIGWRLSIPKYDALRIYLLEFGTDSAKLLPSLDTHNKRGKWDGVSSKGLRNARRNLGRDCKLVPRAGVEPATIIL